MEDGDAVIDVPGLLDEESEMVQDTGAVIIKLNHDDSKPTDVYSWFEITVKEINIIRQVWSASVEIHVFWQDFKVPVVFPKFDENDFQLKDDDVPIKLSEVFENKFSEQIEQIQFKFLPETSTIYMFLVINVEFVERMELQRFPLDRQFLGMDFNAWTKKGNWNWITEPRDWVPKDFHKQCAVRMVAAIQEYECMPPWINFSEEEPPLSIRLRVERLPSYYFGSIVLPNFLIVAAAFASFPIELDSDQFVADRLSVSVTLMLTAVAFRYVVTDSLPNVAYLTIMDYYLLEGFIILILLISEQSVVGLSGILGFKTRQMIDGICVIVFLTIWGLTHLFALISLFNRDFGRISWERMDVLDSEDGDGFVYSTKQKGRPQSKEVLDEWNKFRGKTPALRASVYAEEHPDLARTTSY